jgi:HSP20 family molecular chaperone IbpA
MENEIMASRDERMQSTNGASGADHDATGIERTRPERMLVPRCDIYEDKDAVHLLAEMPGVDETSIDVTLERSVLTITGRFEPPAPEGLRPVWREFEGGEYRRSFELSNEADADGIRASIEHGLLRVDVPKTKPAQRKIPVMAR